MRDIAITLIILGLVPLIWKQPWTGVLAWLWISVMNPHRYAYGFAYSFPFAAINIANDRPLIGGGFELYRLEVFEKYAPDPLDVHSAHSIYFQMLGENGYVSLALFLAIGLVAWNTANRVIRRSRLHPDSAWAGSLAQAIKVSLIGYAVGGAFINIGYWEIQYYEIIALMVLNGLLKAPKPSPVLI